MERSVRQEPHALSGELQVYNKRKMILDTFAQLAASS